MSSAPNGQISSFGRHSMRQDQSFPAHFELAPFDTPTTVWQAFSEIQRKTCTSAYLNLFGRFLWFLRYFDDAHYVPTYNLKLSEAVGNLEESKVPTIGASVRASRCKQVRRLLFVKALPCYDPNSISRTIRTPAAF